MEDHLRPHISMKFPISDWLFVCGLTSITLILVGFRGVFGKAYRGEVGQKTTSLGENQEGHLSAQTVHLAHKFRRVTGRFLTVWLPFYATLQLGASQVALIMLIGLASNIIAIEDEATDLTRIRTWKLLFAHRRWTVGSIILQLVCDLSGLTSGSTTTNICLGYLALGLSVLVLPPSYPSSRPKVSVVSSSIPASGTATPTDPPITRETPPHPENSAVKALKTSPLIYSPEDSEFTLLSGTALGTFTVIMSIFLRPAGGQFSLAELGWTFFTSFATAVSLTTTDQKSLRSNKSFGMVLGASLSLLLIAQLGIDLWNLFYQTVLIGVSFAFTKLDTHAAFSSTSSYSTHHRHNHASSSHAGEHASMSGFSEFILRNAPNNQLFHSIMVEKDSRRIFYFMW